jgi:hypothetical protein
MYKLMMVIMVAGFAGLFFINGPSGEPILSIDSMTPSVSALDGAQFESPSAPSSHTKVYKWQDEEGVWQFSNQPQDMEGAEVVEIDNNINTIAAFKVPQDKASTQTSDQQLQSGMSGLPAGMTSVSPEKISKMMETVNSLQGVADQKQETLDAITGKN